MNQNENPQGSQNNIFEQNEGQPFARRTVSWAFNLGLIVLVMGLFAGWYFSASDEPDSASANVQMPGNQYERNSVRGNIYDFFYGIFSGGLSGNGGGGGNASLQNPVTATPPAAQGDNGANLSGSPAAGDAAGNAVGNIMVQDQIFVPSVDGTAPVEGNGDRIPAQINVTPEIAPAYFNGKILDDEGRVAGNIRAMIRNNEGERIVYFTLDQSLTPADKPRNYHIAYNEVEIAEEDGATFIRLNKQQTEALAQALYQSNDEEIPADTATPERP